MTRRALAIPILTPELRFALKHWQEMDQLSEGKKSEYKEVRKQVDQIFKRAGADAKVRIMRIAECISYELNEKTRVAWTDRNVESEWGNWGPLRKRRGKSVVASAGVYFDSDKRGIPRVILNVWPKRGMSGCRLIQEECRGQWHGQLSVPQENLEDWPGWEDDFPSVVYHSETLTSRSTLPEMASHASKIARRFLRVAMPYLQKLATG